MNHIVRGRLLLNVTIAALLMGVLIMLSSNAQAGVLGLGGLAFVLMSVNTYLSIRTSSQILALRSSLQRMSSGDYSEPVPLSADEPLGSTAELLERLRKQ